MNRELLERPFAPEQIKQRHGTNGDVLDYIEGSAVIQRLNECFDSEWMFEIQEHSTYDDEVVVLGKLTAQGVTKAQFGKSKIPRSRVDKTIVSLGDDLKAAATDCLKKCATLFGIGLHLYFAPPKVVSDNGNGQSGHVHHTTSFDAGVPDPGRHTAKQLSAIFSLARGRGWTNKQVRDFTHDMFGKVPDDLSKREASAIIQNLQNHSGK